MTSTPREVVYQTLNFENPTRVPRQVWVSPWATTYYPQESDRLIKDFPWDVGHVDAHQKEQGIGRGDAYAIGEFTDDWGCTFKNIQVGVHGEVKDPIIKDWGTDTGLIHVPREWLTVDIDAVNRDCDASEAFLLAGCCPRPFEQLQFIRRTEYLYMDLFAPPEPMLHFMKQMHDFYCELLELWAKKTRVDGLMFMDDWGSQQNLLIHPEIWKEYFKPMYKDYIDIAHSNGKKAFMHSDGFITPIYPELIELGLDAINSQIFCMGVENLKPFAGKITFWGEIDRQHLLTNATLEELDEAIHSVATNLWRGGGCIAQCEFGPGARPENVRQVYESWKKYPLVD